LGRRRCSASRSSRCGLCGRGGSGPGGGATAWYDDYLRELAKTHPDDLAVLAVSLIGPRNQVAKLVRHLELLH
jgi:hypothetical protein